MPRARPDLRRLRQLPHRGTIQNVKTCLRRHHPRRCRRRPGHHLSVDRRRMRVAIKHPPTRRQLGGVASIAAPLLAAGSLAVIGVIIQEPDSLRFPTLALAILATAATALVLSVSASVWAAYYDVTPPGDALVTMTAPRMTHREYYDALNAYAAYRFWVQVTRKAYHVGLYSLWIGLGIALVPDPFSSWRLITLMPIVAALILELSLHRRAPQAGLEPPHWVRGEDMIAE